MFDIYITCKKCGREEIVGWHPVWGVRELCWECRDKMYKKHSNWMDQLLKRGNTKRNEGRMGNVKDPCLKGNDPCMTTACGPSREKEWKELTTDEAVERTRQYVKSLIERIDRLEVKVSQLYNHSHNILGGLVKQMNEYDGASCMGLSKSNRELF